MSLVKTGEEVRVRIAPSPTGPFHWGTARTALFNWLFARQHGGKFLVRIDDTDTVRSEKKYEEQILRGLEWLGLDYDEGPDTSGPYGPYRQSERTALYHSHLERLLSEKKAYYCYCTKEDLEAERQSMLADGLAPKYSGHCRTLERPPLGKSAQIIRFHTPEIQVEFKDLIRGKISFDAATFGDFAIAKSLNEPLFHFAGVVDDELMEITHIIRGEDHISNTPKHILLAHALGFKEQTYAHLPLILGANREKLSKRQLSLSLLDYRDQGFIPEAILNFLAFLGWHPQGNEEVLSKYQLIEQFDLKRVQKGGAAFNEEKLRWLNAEHLHLLSPQILLERLLPFIEERKWSEDHEFILKIIQVEQPRMKTLEDFFTSADFFFTLPDYPASLLSWKNQLPTKSYLILKNIEEKVRETKEFSREKITSLLEPLIKEEGRGEVLWPLRVALSGKKASPDPFEIMEVLSQKETLKRLEVAIQKLS